MASLIVASDSLFAVLQISDSFYYTRS